MIRAREDHDIRICMLVTDDVVRSARVRKEARTLASAGFNVTVVGIGDCVAEELEEEDYRVLMAPRQPEYKGKPLAPKWGGEHVWYPVRVAANLTVTKWRTWQWKKQLADNTLFEYHVDYPQMKPLALSAHPDIIHCHDVETLWVGYRVAQETGALLVYDSWELYLELHYLSDLARERLARIEARVFPELDAFITVNPDIASILLEKYSSSLTPVILYNSNPYIAPSVARPSVPVKLFFQGKFAFDRNLPELVEAMDYLRGKATLTLQGWGEDEPAILRTIEELKLGDIVKVIAPCSTFDVVKSASNYDIGIINSSCDDENFKYCLPNKFFDYLCGGLAIVSTDLLSLKKVIAETGSGITYKQEGPESTAKALLGLINDPDMIYEMKKRSLLAAPRYAWPAQEEKLLSLYESLVERLENR